ncbi:MAG: hypothetical protein QM749_07405 [Aquabacterium sp.]
MPAKLLAGLGLEPSTRTSMAPTCMRAWKGRKVSIKQALLAGDVVGAGNLSLARPCSAGIDPRLQAGRI